MSMIRKHTRLLLVAICCVAGGSRSECHRRRRRGHQRRPSLRRRGRQGGQGGQGGKAGRKGLAGLARRSVSGQFVVHTKQGFQTVTLDRGVVDSVTGQQLKLTEGTPKATYKTVTLTIPATARVRDDRQKSTLSAVKPGQRVLVDPGAQADARHRPHAQGQVAGLTDTAGSARGGAVRPTRRGRPATIAAGGRDRQPASGPSVGVMPNVSKARKRENVWWSGPWKSEEPVVSSPAWAQWSTSSRVWPSVWVT